MAPECLNIPLNYNDIIEIIGDYAIPILLLLYMFNLMERKIIKPYVLKYFFTGFILCAPFEYIQPKLDWVFYLKCDTYYWAPMNIMWIVHAIWDSFMLLSIYYISNYLYVNKQILPLSLQLSCTMSILGMAQEIWIETLWYYQPTKWNPQWATINGRVMTLQQWHWAILPIIYYGLISDNYQ